MSTARCRPPMGGYRLLVFAFALAACDGSSRTSKEDEDDATTSETGGDVVEDSGDGPHEDADVADTTTPDAVDSVGDVPEIETRDDASDTVDVSDVVDAADVSDTFDTADTLDATDATDATDGGDVPDATITTDTGIEDTEPSDSANDTTVGDTTVGDTTVGDTTVGDTTVGDTTVGDTSDIADSAADSDPGDTTVAETSADTDDDGGNGGDAAADADAGTPACPAVCFDDSPCTVDGCAPDGTCLDGVAPRGTACPMGVCDGFGFCVVCVNDRELDAQDTGCPPGAPMCDGGNRCGACLYDRHCPAGLICDPVDLVCTNCETDLECDDGFDCTEDVCNDRICDHFGDDTRCDNGLFCDGFESCDPLSLDADDDGCVANDPERNDKIGCTVDTCDEVHDVMVHTPDDARCAGDSPCVTATCSAVIGCVTTPVASATLCAGGVSVCSAGACRDCIDAGSGTDPGCGPSAPFCVAGACVACEGDGDCGDGLACAGGACFGCSSDVQCDDGVACTDDVCDLESTTCVHVTDDLRCDDGAFCNGSEACRPESAYAGADGCVVAAPAPIDDGIDCTLDECDEDADAIVHTPDRELCDDGLVCTFENCDLVLGCQHLALTGQSPCDGDEGVCGADGTCGLCADTRSGGVDPGCLPEAPSCVAGTCTVCAAEGPGCPLDCAGVPDGPARGDLCGNCDADPTNDCLGLCDGLPCGAPCDDSIPEACDDANPCTLDRCVAGRCRNDATAMDGTLCDDQSLCTSAATCSAGACVGTAPLFCGHACETGACDPARGCLAKPEGTPCNEGISPGQCTGRTCKPVCDDGNACTFDHWESIPFLGRFCASTPIDPNTLPGAASMPCVTLTCDPGSGALVETLDTACLSCAQEACDRPCYTGNCRFEGGCEPSPAGTECDDGNDDTSDDTCDGNGSCFGVCPAPPECGTSFSFDGTCLFVDPQPAEFDSCPEVDDNPCTVEYCSDEGTCEQMFLPGHSCEHPCGEGICNAEGTCDLSVDQCRTKLGPCWQDAACDLSRGVCDGTPSDPYCREPGAVCDPDYFFCRGAGETCGDGVCEGDERISFFSWEWKYDCGGCPQDCQGDKTNCNQTVRTKEFHSVYQGGGSSAYGYKPPHQNQTITRMLEDDITWFHQRIDYCDAGAEQGDLCLCEGKNDCPTSPVRLNVMLGEISDYLATHETLVVLQFDSNWVRGADLRQAIGDAGLGPYLYRRFNHEATLEPWDIDVRTMINKGLKLVVFGPGFLSTDHLFYAVQPYLRRGDPNAQLNDYALDLFGDGFEFSNDDKVFDCADRSGHGPTGFDDPRIFVLRHVYSELPTWDLTACYNRQWSWHSWTCPEEWWFDADLERAGVILTNYYNSARGPWYEDGWAPYPDSCPRKLDRCKTDADCPTSNATCSFFGNCIQCVRDEDCRDGEWCDGQLQVCRPLLVDGAVCEGNRQCESQRCRLVCTSCEDDVDCEDGEFCDFLGACRTKRDIGTVCTKDDQCASDACHLGYCSDCADDSDCGGGEYCTLNVLPGKSACAPKKAIDLGCTRDEMCAGGNCYLGYCRECDELEDCAADEYCEPDNGDPDLGTCVLRGVEGDVCERNVECLSGDCRSGECVENCADGPCGDGRWCDILNVCHDQKENGAGCTGDDQCQSDTCYFNECVECDEQSDCSADTFCSLAVGGGSACIDKRVLGEACAQGFECASEACFLLECAECNSQDDCAADEFCTLTPGNSDCIDKKPIAHACVNDFECASGNCWNLVCAACDEQSDCPADEYCTLNVIGPADSACAPKKDFGDACLTGVECLNGGCIAFQCAECSEDSQCAANEFCSLLGECVPDLDNGTACTRESMCTSGHCPAGFCRECGTDAHCAADDHCSATFQCVADLDNGALCTRDTICTSSHCVAGVCRECDGDANCAPSDHCNAVNQCADDLANGQVCLRDSFCQSGECVAGFCRECATDANCAAGDHCSATFQCVADLANGTACTRDTICSSGHCVAGFCRACENDSHCAASDHCNGVFQCVDDFANGTACLSDSACTSGHCVAGFCRECEGDANCPSNEHCNGLFQCEADVGNNQPCLRDSFCATGFCISGFCAECQGDGDCATNEYCSTLKECVPDHGNNGTCTRNAMCSTGICSAGFCAECTQNSHCASNQYCDAGGDCQNKKADGLSCTKDAQCLTGCCGLLKCGGGACP